MWFSKALIVLAAAGSSLATCGIYPEIKWDKLHGEKFFSIQVHSQNRAIEGLKMNLLPGGGGDKDMYVSLGGGESPRDLYLENGVITQVSGNKVIRVVISGNYDHKDATTKMFMTERADTPANFTVHSDCRNGRMVHVLFGPDVEKEGEGNPHICVKPGHDGRYDFRFSEGHPDRIDPNRMCIPVTLELLRTTGRRPTKENIHEV